MRQILFACALLCAGCPGLGQVGFDVTSQGNSQIPGSPVGGALPPFGGLSNMTFNNNQSFSNNNTNKDHISSCRVSKLTLKVIDPAGGSISFLNDVEFYIQTSSLPQLRIAHSTTIPPGSSTIELTPDDQEIAAYAKSDSFSITTKAAGSAPPQNTTIEADLTLHIVANVL